MTNSLIVSDSGPLIALAKINELSLLFKLFHGVFIPEAVYTECTLNPTLPGAQLIQSFINKKEIHIKKVISESKIESLFILDEGETEAILLAKKLNSSLLIDEKRGRSVARNLGIKVIGTAGLLLKGHQKGFLKNLKDCLTELQKKGYRLSDDLVNEILKRSMIN